MTTDARRTGGTPTVLLVHGAFTDTSSWAGVLRELTDPGADVVTVPNPLRDLAGDAADVAAAAAAVDGPVLLVGHGYGGAVITVAAAGAPDVVGLVFVAAFVPDRFESCVDLIRENPDDAFLRALRPVPRPGAGPGATELYLRRDRFREVFAADVAPAAAEVAAACQRPVTAAALEGRPASVGWERLPCWCVVANDDRVLDAATQRRTAARAGAVTVEVDASHAVLLSRPDVVAGVVRLAAGSVARSR